MKTLTRDDIDQMTEVEKLELISELEDSLAQNQDALTPEQEAELDRRLANYDEELAGAVTWEELKAELLENEAPKRRRKSSAA